MLQLLSFEKRQNYHMIWQFHSWNICGENQKDNALQHSLHHYLQ